MKPRWVKGPTGPDSATVGTGIALTLYNQGYWFYLTQAFSDLMDGDPDFMFSLADSYNGREDGSYADRSLDVYFAEATP